MPTLRRILKYTPAAVLGLLVVAWVVSLFGKLTLLVGDLRPLAAGANGGSLVIATGNQTGWLYVPRQSPLEFRLHRTAVEHPAGRICYNPHPCAGFHNLRLEVPIACLLGVILPFAIGPFLSFRFRLWHYLAYTAVVAVELAYYLRWQE